MASVSQVAQANLFTNTADKSGGKNSATKRPMLRAASMDAKAAQSSLSDTKLAMTSNNIAAVSQQAQHLATNKGGGSL
jgi:hypothetical protein